MCVDLMEFMYRVMEELSNAGIPIVFKGAMVLNLVIRENNPSKVERMTRDIYVISFITEIDVDELHQIWADTGRKLGNFRAYKAQFVELKEAYDKMKGVKNKPDFYEVYQRVSNVVCKFEF